MVAADCCEVTPGLQRADSEIKRQAAGAVLITLSLCPLGYNVAWEIFPEESARKEKWT